MASFNRLWVEVDMLWTCSETNDVRWGNINANNMNQVITAFLCTLFLSFKYARCESQQKKVGHIWIFEVMCDLCTRECGVVFVAKFFVHRGDKLSRPHTHVIFNPNKECTPSNQKNYDLSNIQDTPTNSHTWLIKQIILHIMGKKKGVRFEAAPPRTSQESLQDRSTPKHPPDPTTHYKPMPNSMKLCLIHTKQNNRWRALTANML